MFGFVSIIDSADRSRMLTFSLPGATYPTVDHQLQTEGTRCLVFARQLGD